MAVATVNFDQESMQNEAEQPRTAQSGERKPATLGLGPWMQRVLEECDEAEIGFESDPVHDLRVAIRRCRSLGEGLMLIDPDKAWKRMRKAGKTVFSALGELRDVQVMQEWVEKIGFPQEPATKTLQDFISARETALKKQAMTALHDFDRKQWAAWSKELPRRAARIKPGSIVFQHMALERWMAARHQQRAALRNKSGVALHQLRILIKKFRYTVENFLPEQHQAWGDDLKKLQDWLGEVHDLDVLWACALEQKVFVDDAERSRWHEKVQSERQKRVEKYREKMLGERSLWTVWRQGLPKGPEIRAAAWERLKVWASFQDPDFAHSQRVAEMARELYEGIAADVGSGRAGSRRSGAGKRATSGKKMDLPGVLYAAALMHDVSRAKKDKRHHKRTAQLVMELTPPLGVSAEELRFAAYVARYHRGALPRSRHKVYTAVPTDLRPTAMYLAGILRFANVLDIPRHGRTGKIKVQSDDAAVRVFVPGYSPYSEAAEGIASARFLLERSLRKPIAVKALVERSARGAKTSRVPVRNTSPVSFRRDGREDGRGPSTAHRDS
jgi:CHAD domain-containing protein